MAAQYVEVKLELGHRASLKNKTSETGFTHDWTIFVRGPDGSKIEHFVEKVIFYLHESFHKPKRVVKEPPYQVTESGYAGFNMMIEVCFKNKEEPKRVQFDYDLYLHLEGPAILNCRCEKLTFQNPTEEFRKKLMKGGAVALSGAASQAAADESSGANHHVRTETEPYQGSLQPQTTPGAPAAGQRPTSSSKQPSSTISSSTVSAQKGSNQVPKKTPKSSSGSLTSNNSKPTQIKEVSRPPEPVSQPFTEIFGTPIKTKPSPDQKAKNKESIREKSTKSSKLVPPTTNSAGINNADVKANSSVSLKPHKESKSSHKSSKHSKALKKKESLESKPSSKPPKSPQQLEKRPTPSDTTAAVGTNKRKRATSTSSTTSRDGLSSKPASESKKTALEPPKAQPAKEEVHKEQRKAKEKRQKEKSNDSSNTNNQTSSQNVNVSSSKPEKSSKSVPSESLKKESKEDPTEKTNVKDGKESNGKLPVKKNASKNEAKKRKQPKESPAPVKKEKSPPTPPPAPPPPPPIEEKMEVREEVISSSPDSLASSSPQGAAEMENHSGPLATMIAQMEEQDILSPLSSDQESEEEEEENPNKRRRARRSERSSSKENRNVSGETQPPHKVFHKAPSTNGNSRQDSPSTPPHSLNNSSEVEDTADDAKKLLDHAYLNELKDLQGKIMSLKDQEHLQRIVDLIEETGLYQVSGASFDFDLCALDRSTVQRLQNFLAVK